eukprot:15442781-Alexandrium_andersonii.AAC.1
MHHTPWPRTVSVELRWLAGRLPWIDLHTTKRYCAYGEDEGDDPSDIPDTSNVLQWARLAHEHKSKWSHYLK